MIDTPGIYTLSAAEYHADPCPEPSLSASIAKVICLQSAAHAQHEHPRLNPALVREEADHFDLGTVAHAVLLEGQAAVAVLDFKDWRTNAAKEARDQARAAGKTPLLAKVWDDVQAMIAALRLQLAEQRDGGAAMFTSGDPEQTLIWQEDDGVWCRARLDWLRPQGDRLIPWAIDDFKSTSSSANPDDFTRKLFEHGYDLQAAWYQRGIEVLTDQASTFRFAVQETWAPYAMSVIGLGPDAWTLAEKKRLYALEQWTRGLREDHWPTYPARTCYASLPAWQEAWWLEKECR